MIPKFEIVHEIEIVQEVPNITKVPETPSFKTLRKNNILIHTEKIDVSRYTEIKLVNAREVSSNPNIKYAIALSVFGGLVYLYPNEISNLKFYLNGNEIKLPTDSIERLYVELYKLLHMEYLKALVDEL